jgi:hypothetical protein
MTIPQFPFQIINWKDVPKEEHQGETGTATWQVLHIGNVRIRKMIYSANYKADHWCNKGHIIHCIEGEMNTELDDGRIMKLSSGMTYVVGDKCEAHKTSTQNGCELFVVD